MFYFQVKSDDKKIRNKLRQRKHRKNLTVSERIKNREKAKIKMQKFRQRRSLSQANLQRKLNRESRYLQRFMKRTGLSYKSDVIDIQQHNFNCYIKSLQWVECPHCKKKSIHSSVNNFRCTKNCNIFNVDNDLDPLDVPSELKSLTFIEKQLISRVHPVISLYRVKKLQYKYKGQVINFSQNIQEVADTLPHLICDLNNVVVVKLQDSVALKDFIVRKQVVLDALIWLKNNNPHYSDVKIDSERIQLLPNESNVYQDLKMTIDEYVPSNLKDDISETDDTQSDDCDDSDELSYTSVPNENNPSLSKSFSNELVWPTIGSIPLNEFASPGYISMAFPHLFCYGAADFSMPRKYKVSLKDYIRHLMLYKDQRFAKDERFRYFIMNSEMRWDSLNLGNIYVKKNSIFSKMTILQLKDYFKDNPWIVKQIMHFGSRLRSTKSYWNSRCSELLDMVNQIGTPTVFFTLSSADYHWPDLYRLLGYDVLKLSVKERSEILAENPLIADTFFYLRSKFFLENSFTNHFNVKDIWYRYEYQHRGSIHLHGLAWFQDAPKISNDMSDIEKQSVLSYFDNLISCKNPDIHSLPLSIHPCQVSLENVVDIDKDLCHLINSVQRHTKCRKNHCLRKGKDHKLTCRYKFPKPMVSETNFEVNDQKIVDINFERNDVYLNKFNRWVLQTWRSNIDFSPIISSETVYRYIAKYASKSELKSISYNEVLANIITKSCDDSETAKKAIRKLLVSTCGERDYSSQEVMHFLMGYHFYHSSRDFVVINLRNLDWTSVSGTYSRLSIFDLYSKRPQLYDKISLYEFGKLFTLSRGKIILRRRSAVVRCFPKIQVDISCENFENYCSKLFYPWRDLDDVSHVDSEMISYAKSCFKKYIVQSNSLDSDNENSEDEDDGYNGPSINQKADNHSVLSSYNPNKAHRPNYISTNTESNMKWDYLSDRVNKETVHIICEKLQTNVAENLHQKLDYSILNRDQLKVFNHIKSLTQNVRNHSNLKYTFTIVQGMAGTGKSYLLKCCAQYIKLHLGSQSVKLVAPTGVAAKLISGSTLHSFLSLGRYNNNIGRLSGIELLNFKQKNDGVKFILVDEYSMVGLKLLCTLEQRCKDISGSENLFGDLHLILFGDVNQLLPIGDQPLYAEVNNLSQHHSLFERGKMLIMSLTHAFILKKCHRFADPAYINILRKVATGRCSVVEVNSLKQRHVNCLSKYERQHFKDSIRICATNETANEYNIQKLQSLNKSIAVIKAENNNKTAFACSDDFADGLTNILSISIGAKVMLRRNLNVSRGLVNGAIGVIKHILYENGVKPPSLPVCVFIRFESVDVTDLNISIVPIVPILSHWYKNGISCTRFQLPLALCWACTIHKSQGLSLLNIVLDAGSSEFALGLLYVALSRVPDIKSLCLVVALSLVRLNSCRKSSRFIIRRQFLKKLKYMSKMQ